MDNSSKFDFAALLLDYQRRGKLSPKLGHILASFFESYNQALKPSGQTIDDHKSILMDFLVQVVEQSQNPYTFQPYHEHIRAPFDYYQFGLDFLRPLVELSKSTVSGLENLAEIQARLEKKENAIFLANHQTEGDPQAISLLLENRFPKLAEEMIFVAGERVTTDPLAIPFSMGRNLLCIYSKRYIDHPPELKTEKQFHNQRTMQLMSELLSEGGKSIYVAPSGGRDRPGEDGIVQVAPFDAQSIEMFYLMTQRSKRPTHFYPMALRTYDVLPPPETVQVELGEKRRTRRAAIHLFVGKKIDMKHYPGSENVDKHVRRKCRADYIWGLVTKAYGHFPGV